MSITLPPRSRAPRSAAPRAPMPTPPVRSFSFTDFSTNNPTTPQPGNQLDSNYDQTNASVSSVITWASVSLNTDGTIRDAIITENNLVSGLFDDIAQGIIDQVQPLVDDAQGFANAAAGSSTTAQAAATAAANANTAAGSAAASASASASTATIAKQAALGSANTASTAATAAANAADDAAGAEAIASDYAVLTQAWAEHMPDPIPPNILAVMGITGDHWSSRWWANKAAAAFGGAIVELYLGVWPSPPLQTSTGEPIPLGAIYYNSTTHQVYVWDGTQWQNFWAPTKAYTFTLSYLLTAGQTTIALTTPDLAGNTYGLSTVEPEPLDIYLNGVRLSPTTNPTPDWTVDFATSTITLAYPALAGTLAVIDILTPVNQLAPSRVVTKMLLDFDVNPSTGSPGQIDGTRTVFPLALASDHSTVSVLSPVELQVILDGGIQKPGVDYLASGSNITFAEAPIPGEAAWAIWFGS